ncbi:MAG: hypothetical protein PHI18_10525, partial [bacterium]|nr:hypothetical protein [bacterium]
ADALQMALSDYSALEVDSIIDRIDNPILIVAEIWGLTVGPTGLPPAPLESPEDLPAPAPAQPKCDEAEQPQCFNCSPV